MRCLFCGCLSNAQPAGERQRLLSTDPHSNVFDQLGQRQKQTIDNRRNTIIRHRITNAGNTHQAYIIEKKVNASNQDSEIQQARERENKSERDILTRLSKIDELKPYIVSIIDPPSYMPTTPSSLYFRYNHEIDLFNAITSKRIPPNLFKKQREMIYHQLAQAVLLLYTHSIVHADIKPENILVRSQGGTIRIKICDFGQARTTKNLHPFIQGTIGYRPPEVVLENKLHDKSDIWSLALVFYFIRTSGRELLSIDNLAIEQTLLKSYQKEPSYLHQHLKNRQCQNFLKQMLQLNPSDRISHNTLAETLEPKKSVGYTPNMVS